MKEKMYTVAVKVSESVHKDLKVLCALKQIPMSELLTEKVFEEVAKYRVRQKELIREIEAQRKH